MNARNGRSDFTQERAHELVVQFQRSPYRIYIHLVQNEQAIFINANAYMYTYINTVKASRTEDTNLKNIKESGWEV